MANAAGGTIQRLKPGLAMILCRSRNPAFRGADNTSSGVSTSVVMIIPPCLLSIPSAVFVDVIRPIVWRGWCSAQSRWHGVSKTRAIQHGEQYQWITGPEAGDCGQSVRDGEQNVRPGRVCVRSPTMAVLVQIRVSPSLISRQALKAPKAADQCRSGALDAGESCAGSEHCHCDVFRRFVHAEADNLSEIGRPRVAKARISHRFCFGMRVALRLARQQCRPLCAAPPGLAARPGSAIVTECRSAQFTF